MLMVIISDGILLYYFISVIYLTIVVFQVVVSINAGEADLERVGLRDM